MLITANLWYLAGSVRRQFLQVFFLCHFRFTLVFLWINKRSIQHPYLYKHFYRLKNKCSELRNTIKIILNDVTKLLDDVTKLPDDVTKLPDDVQLLILARASPTWRRRSSRLPRTSRPGSSFWLMLAYHGKTWRRRRQVWKRGHTSLSWIFAAYMQISMTRNVIWGISECSTNIHNAWKQYDHHMHCSSHNMHANRWLNDLP